MERAAHCRAELFAYDQTEPSQLLGKSRISTQPDRKLRPLRVGVVADPISKTIGRVTVQEGDGRGRRPLLFKREIVEGLFFRCRVTEHGPPPVHQPARPRPAVRWRSALSRRPARCPAPHGR